MRLHWTSVTYLDGHCLACVSECLIHLKCMFTLPLDMDIAHIQYRMSLHIKRRIRTAVATVADKSITLPISLWIYFYFGFIFFSLIV